MSETTTPTNTERTPDGRFNFGNKGNPGNPFARKSAHFRKLFIDLVEDEDLEVIVRDLIEKARQGDLQAQKLVLSYTIGRPGPAPDPDRIDADEIEAMHDNMADGDKVERLTKGMQASAVVPMLR